MTQMIRHRRLEAFYKSKVLNSMMIAVVTSLFLMSYTESMLLPVICSTVSLCFFIGYSLWLWIKKPKQIIINEWLSNINGLLTLYFLIVMGINDASFWWYILPAIAPIVIIFICLIQPKDEKFDI